MSYSPEMETLDQLLGGVMSLEVVRQLYPSDAHFSCGLLGLLRVGDVRLLELDGSPVAEWRWRELFEDGAVLGQLSGFCLDVTPQGAKKVS